MSDTPTTTVSEAILKTGAADVLDTIANLSNDEVFTPPKLANQVLDLLPSEVWKDSSLKFLDPCVKTGVFLREIVKRLMVGLKDEIPDERDRREHILRNQIYGIAITELTALMSRRTVYCSSDATRERNPDFPENCYSAVKFDEPEGNIAFPLVGHCWPEKKGVIAQSARCEVCGAKYSDFTGDDREGMESYAYPFIHMDIKEIFGEMKFDVVIGNPPYQLSDGGHAASASPIYHKFISLAQKLQPKYLSMIIPARWYSGGKGLNEFRKNMLESGSISVLVDVPNEKEAFPGVRVSGGVCYFLMAEHKTRSADVYTMKEGALHYHGARDLSKRDVFVRSGVADRIIDKVATKTPHTMAPLVSPHKPFGVRSNFNEFCDKDSPSAIVIHTAKGPMYVEREKITDDCALIDKYKIFLGRAYGEEGAYPYRVTGRPFIAGPGEVCTETYIAVGPFDTQEDAGKALNYVKTKFVRYLCLQRKASQLITRNVFGYVPWGKEVACLSDDELAKYFNLEDSEVQDIYSTIKDIE